MDRITKLAETITTTVNITDKVKMIYSLNEMIVKERNELNHILEHNIENVKTKISPAYKKMTLDELEIEFTKTTDIHEKITIYHAICKNINNISDELFDTD